MHSTDAALVSWTGSPPAAMRPSRLMNKWSGVARMRSPLSNSTSRRESLPMNRGASRQVTINRPFGPMLYPQKSSPEAWRVAISSSVSAVPSTSATRVSPLKQRA